VAVAEDIGLDGETATDHAFRGKATAIDLRRNPFDCHAAF
jgi:hypothetical protein